MFSRFTHVATILLVAAAFAAAQSPYLVKTTPKNANPTDASSLAYEAVFSEPVSGVNVVWNTGGTHGGAPTPITSTSCFGRNPSFDADAERLIAPSGITMGTSWTVEFWVRPTVGGFQRAVFSYASPGNDNEILYFTDGEVGIDNAFFSTPATAPANQFTHIAICKNSGLWCIYKNGVLALAVNDASVIPSGGYLVIGDDQDSFGGGFNPAQSYHGQIDELRIWSVERSGAQLMGAMFTPIDPATPGLAHYWSMDATTNLGVGSPGSNDYEDLVGSADLSAENSLGNLNSQMPCATWEVLIGTAGITSPGTVFIDLPVGNSSTRDFDGNLTVANPVGGAANASYLFQPCPAAPQVIAQGPTAPTADTTPTRQLVFDQVVEGVDAGDLTLGGVAVSGATITGVSSIFETAAELPTDTDYLRGFHPFPNSGPMTVECWFRTGNSDDPCVFSYATNSPSSQDNTLTLWADGKVFVDNTGLFPAADLGQLDGGWHHMAVTRSAGGTMTRYIDGIPAGVKSGANSAQASNGSLVFGQDQDVYGAGFQASQALDGAVDEIRIWNVERSAAQIAASYCTVIDPLTAGLVNYWQCQLLANGDCLVDSTSGALLDFGPAFAAFLTDGPGKSVAWDVELNFPGVTSFLEIDLVPGHGIQNYCGMSAPANPAGPEIEHVYVEDMTTEVSVNGGAAEYYIAGAAPGDQLLIRAQSPGGAHDWLTVPTFFGQLIPTGTEPGDVGIFGFPELRLDLFSPQGPFVIYDGATAGPFAPSVLAPGGVNVGAIAPAGLGGFSLACQIIANGNVTTTNGFFAASNVLVIDL